VSYYNISVISSLLLVSSIIIPFGLIDFNNQVYGLSDFNIDSVGDWGCNSNTKSTVNNIKGKSPELVLALGDYSYQPTATCWLNTISSIKGITKINIGNHENDADEDLNKYLSSFGLSKQYYSYNFQNVHVLTMATEISFSTSSAQYNFVKNDLAAASNNPNIKWIIVNYHRAMYTSPNTCSSSTCHGSSSLRDAYHPLFDKYGVDLVLQGHVHNYQRTFPIKYNPSSPSNPTKTSTSTSTYTDPPGEIFAIVGTGGINFHGLSGKSSFVVSQQDSQFGILDLQITDNGNKLQAKYITNGGSVKDQFSISKSATTSGYHYDPSLSLSGSNYFDIPSSSSLQLSKFTVAAWFKTSTDYSSDAFIVNKGGLSSDNPGENLNYGIWMSSTEQIKGGFETINGDNNWISSPNSYRDGVWHYAVVTFDGSTIRFYVDGVLVNSKSTSASPDNSGSQPLRVGADSNTLKSFFTGNVDEVRVWNRALSAQEVSDAYGGTFNTSGQVAYISSGSSISSFKATSLQSTNITKNATSESTDNQTANIKSPNKSANNSKTPELPEIVNKSEASLNNKVEPSPSNNLKNNSISSENQNNNTEKEVKPVIPRDTEKNIQSSAKNILPDAKASKNQIVTEGSKVTLDGTKSNDKDGKIESYQWQQISGPKVELDNSNKSKSDFVSPSVDHDVILVFKLTVTDDKGGSDSSITVVKVAKNGESFTSSSNIQSPSQKSETSNEVNSTSSSND
jgi:Concanavalin A-like lectin/glucanases superfamily/Calcineurin-like phosphoesterase